MSEKNKVKQEPQVIYVPEIQYQEIESTWSDVGKWLTCILAVAAFLYIAITVCTMYNDIQKLKQRVEIQGSPEFVYHMDRMTTRCNPDNVCLQYWEVK